MTPPSFYPIISCYDFLGTLGKLTAVLIWMSMLPSQLPARTSLSSLPRESFSTPSGLSADSPQRSVLSRCYLQFIWFRTWQYILLWYPVVWLLFIQCKYIVLPQLSPFYSNLGTMSLTSQILPMITEIRRNSLLSTLPSLKENLVQITLPSDDTSLSF